ncbi:MAG: hypothetical protein U9Q33_12700 [Campylobacterota bacterium]|nr:hypothetical protein [Campylobacterota bacterium]
MQIFGIFKEQYELEYLTKCYVYLNKDEEDKIDTDTLNLLLKKKNKNVAGTIFLYNPFTAPIGYDKNEKLLEQGYKFTDKFVELQDDDAIRIVAKNLKAYAGKLVEIKYLFNYNKDNIQPTSALEVFDMDIEKLHTNQLTVFSKQHNFQDYKNISYNGKFIFFAWGHKFEKSLKNISLYSSNISQWALKAGKDIGFIYDGSQDEAGSFEYTKFMSPVAHGKLKLVIPNALHEVFSKEHIKPFCIKDMLT